MVVQSLGLVAPSPSWDRKPLPARRQAHHRKDWLDYYVGHEMGHLWQGTQGGNPDTNTTANPAAVDAIHCVKGPNATSM
jgi:hypothetical protein